MTQAQKAFVERIGKAAAADMVKSGVLASLKIAQAILESGWGTSTLAVKANALFGIKADTRWNGPVYNVDTKEVYSGVTTTVSANFRAYGSWEESNADHTAFLLANQRYAAVIGQRDYKAACRAIHAAGYATDPGYSDKLIKVIEQYNLTAYDTAATNGGNKKMRITIDPGHGERGNPYPPTPGFFEGTQMWRLAQHLTAELEKRGFEVVNTRPKVTDDPALSTRGGMAATNGSVMFYSLHSNAPGSPSQTTVTGSEVFISASGEKFRPLAESLLKAVCAAMGHNSRGVKIEPGFTVIRSAVNGGLPCAMLMEHGFHTNPKDAAFLTNENNLKRLAEVQAEVLAAHFGAKPAAGTPTAPAPTPATPAPSAPTQTATTKPTAFKVGDVVQFTGGGVYTSSTQHIAAHTRDRSRCKVTQIATQARNQYHLISEDGGRVHGWVVSEDVTAIGQAAAAPFKEYTVRVDRGAIYRKGPGANQQIAGTITNGGVFTIVEEQNGWGRLKSGAGWLNLADAKRL